MIVPKNNLRTTRRRGRALIWLVMWGALLVVLGWTFWVHEQIQGYATRDEARPADAIAVFGAAEYDGRPSPVLRARLDHGLALYREKLAPMMITLGGGAAADVHSEGGVGHDYLLAQGVPEAAIIAETTSSNTEQSAQRLAAIARTNKLRRVLVVSDGTHLFRIHALCESFGLTVYTSPRPVVRELSWREAFEREAHEILSYTAWRLRSAPSAATQ
ncbi:YdcF family protein [Silvibacterium acidisoli]|uniref:YdcF family protein n=1 Tax=Acidobacteriaceae bacterium ZG23-2 TaxID=2883246 RepID=UPI00406CBED0